LEVTIQAVTTTKVTVRNRVLAAPPSKFSRLKSYYRRYQKSILTAAAASFVLLAASICCIVLAITAAQVNQKLSAANYSLTNNISELESAKSKIRAAATKQQYDSAISIAMIKFENEFHDELTSFAEEAFENRHHPDPEFPTLIEMVEMTEGMESVLATFGLCFDYDQSRLLEIPHKDLLSDSLGRIDEQLTQEKEFLNRVFEDLPTEKHNRIATIGDFNGSEHEHSEECLAISKRANQEIVKWRPRFYRHLVEQYRRSFGEKNSRVAEALNMLAASLMAINDFNEAEARLREAAAIADEKNSEITRQLMILLRKSKKQSAKSK
jgi:hypothetical protein